MSKVNDIILNGIALSVRMLSVDAISKANSGHPGLPLGLAELGALLFAEVLSYNPADSQWKGRDRLVLSAGHGSMWLYSLLHLSGYKVTLSDIKKFRQFGSKTPGHPEYGHVDGVETTTGPLGAGFSNGVGMAIAERMISKKFKGIINNYTYVVSGDGCMMEGITSESASLAGHLKLGKLIVFYDSNGISIEGSTDLAFTEDVSKRYASYNWQVLKVNAHNYESMRKAIAEAKKEKNKPSIIICKSIIGKGAPTLQGTEKVHGAPLPQKECEAMKRKYKIDPQKQFYIDPNAIVFFAKKKKKNIELCMSWNKKLSQWKKTSIKNKREWDGYFDKKTTKNIQWPQYKKGDSLATRKANGACIEAISQVAEWFTGGSADLQPSNNTKMSRKSFTANNWDGRMMHYGVREHAMGGIVNGMTLYGGLSVFGATFLVFADYMRPALRLAAIMKIPSNFIFTHDSIFVGEDGPTHQPVEQLASLRLIPDLRVFRPADAQESVLAWEMAFSQKKHNLKSSPNALLFTRQNITVFDKPTGWQENAKRGAYVVVSYKQKKKGDDLTLVATGSEVSVALEAAKILSKCYTVRVVSMFCKELYDDKKEKKWKETIIPHNSKVVVVEAGVPMGWDSIRPIGHVSINEFGSSGPASTLAEYYGLVPAAIAKKVETFVK